MSSDTKDQKVYHAEWEVENSLTAPSDRDHKNKKYKPILSTRKLSEKEVEHALDDLNNTTFTHKYLRVERRYADPVDPMQRIGLISWVPAKGATPNERGIYGFAKLRGNFATEREASEKAENIIREVDSYHKIFHCYIGRPFPLTLNTDFSKEKHEIDIDKEMTQTMKDDIKQKKNKEKKIKKEIQQRAENIRNEVDRETQDPEEVYTMLKVKKAQLTWAYLEHKKKMEEVKNIIIKTRKEIKEYDDEDEKYEKMYFERYMDARKASGLDDKEKSLKDSFLRYMVEEVDLGF